MSNNKTKMFLLLTLVFITILGVSAVTAADNDNITADTTPIVDDATTQSIDTIDNSIQTDVSTKNAQINKKTNENVKGDGEGTFADLETDIAGSDVKLTKDYIQGANETNITITEDKTIDGDGHTITATKGIFNINAGVTFTLKNLVVSSSHGPTYQNYWWDLYNNGTLIVNNVTFKYNSPDRTYGGEIWTGANTNLTVSNSVFDGEHTVRSQIYADGANFVMTIDNCTFCNYNASNAAIGLNKAGNLTVTNSVFKDNIESSYGGAIYINNYNCISAINNCTFENLVANFRGGAIYTQGTTLVTNNVFKNLRQARDTYNAGAIWSDNTYAVLYVANNTMENITAKAADIYINRGKFYGPLYVTGENVSADQESPVTIEYTVTDDMGNSVDFLNSPFVMTINDETIRTTYGNGTLSASFDASMDPGVYPITVSCDTTNMIEEPVITENTLTVNDIGLINYAALQAMIDAAEDGATIKIEGPIFRSSEEDQIIINKTVTIDLNGYTLNAKEGRVFYVDNQGIATIKNGEITNVGNKRVANDNVEGRIAFINSTGIMNFSKVYFTNSIAPSNGYAATGSFIIVYGVGEDSTAFLNLEDCKIENCSGTFVNNVKGDVVIDGTIFENNNLYLGYSSSWNALIADGGFLRVIDSSFVNNTPNFAVIDGQSQSLPMGIYGDTYLSYNEPLSVENCIFINNTQGSKGAIHTYNDTTITDSVFIGNVARGYSGYGGAIRSEEGKLDIDKSVFINNSAYYSVSSWSGSVSGNDGTAIANYDGDLTIKNSMIISNITQFAAVYNTADDVNIDINGNYWGNATPDGFYKSTGTAMTVDDYVVFNVTVEPEEDVAFKDNVTVKAFFTNSTDGAQVTTLPDVEAVTFSSTTGTLGQETVYVENNEANTTFTVGNSPFEITATYPNMEAVYTGEAKMPEPMIITLNDGNFTEYFDIDATGTATLKDFIVPNSELRFEGEFNDRYMVIDMPLNLTTADTQGVLKNSQFLIVADNVNVTKLQMTGEDTEEPLILSEDVKNLKIADNTLTVTNTEDEMMTRAIVIDGGSDITIDNNNITTIGPEDPIDYASDSSIRALYLASIDSTANNMVISNNKITTKKNDAEAQELGTIYGVYVHGKDDDHRVTGLEIINNEVITDGAVYEYGIKPSWISNASIKNNTVTTTSAYYASGIHPFAISDSEIRDNTVTVNATDITYGIVIEGAMDYETYKVITPENNNITNNVVNAKSNFVWAIETYAGNNNTISYNNITVNAVQGIGIGVTDQYTTVLFNNIDVTASMEEIELASYDYIDPYTTGVKIANNGLRSVQNNVVSDNNITVTAPLDTISAVNSSTNRNVIDYNFLISPLGFGDSAVIDTGRYGTTEENRPTLPITDETYADYFDEDCVLKPVFNNTDLVISGDFVENTVFIFDGVNVTFTNDGTAKIYEGQIWTGNDATVVFDGLVFENSMDAIVLESEGNVINNTVININSEDAIHAIYVYEAGNTIANTVLNITAPSADVEYNPDYSTKSPAPAAIVISSNNNLVDNVTVTFNANTSTGFYPTVDGIYVVSEKTPVVNNTIKDTTVTVTGTNYVYGINIGNAKDTTIENVNVDVRSLYYADAIQLFDADGISITGTVNAYAESEAYGVYSTAMGYGFSQNIDLTGLDVNVEAAKATGALIEGASNVMIADATYEITGDEATAIKSHVDFMGNIPTNITITGLDIAIDTTGDANLLYFGNASDVTITENNIEATGGSEINFNATPKAVVTDNYILVGEMLETGIFGNYAVITTEEDTVVENNTPTSQLIDDLNDKIKELEDQLAELTKAKETTITIDPLEGVKYGDEITISGTLVNEDSLSLSNQNITIKFNDEETTVTTRNGEFKYTTTATIIGENTITATYAGNDKYNASEATATFTVDKADTFINLTDIEAVKKGDVVSISGVLYDHNNNALDNKVVRLLVNNGRKTVKTNDMGEFSFDYTTTKVGDLTVTATFEGNDYYEATTDETEFTVNKLTTIITLDSIDKAIKGTQTTITGTLTDDEGNAIANAQVKITVNGSPKTLKTDENGVFTHTYTFGQLGANEITATYAGSANYEEATTATTVDVTKAQTVIVFDDIGEVTLGDTATISGTLTDTEGNVVANAQVKLNINGSPKTLKTDENGAFVHTFKMTKEGTNNITAVFNGNNDYETTEATTTVEVIKAE